MLGGLRVFFFSNVRSVPLANMPAIFAGGAGGHARRRQQSVFHPGLSVPVGTGGEQGRENIFHASLQASPGNKRTRSQRATGADAAPLANPPSLPPTPKRWRNTRRRSSFLHPSPSRVFRGRHELLQSNGAEAVTVFTRTHSNSFPRYLKECRVICMEIIRCAVEAQLGHCAYCEHRHNPPCSVELTLPPCIKARNVALSFIDVSPLETPASLSGNNRKC